MKDCVKDALQAATTLQKQISEIKQQISRHDPNYDLVDDADLGIKWAMRRLNDFADLPLPSFDAPSSGAITPAPSLATALTAMSAAAS
jgi:hypothetical protein